MLRYEDAPDPEPADGEILVSLRAASLNHLDIWIRKGLPSVAGFSGRRMVTEVEVVDTPGCDPGGSRFESGRSPHR